MAVSAEGVPELGDAFGLMLRACWDAGQRLGAAFEVIERSDGLISVGDAARYFAGLEDWPAQEKAVLEAVSGTVLDVGCGAGRHAAVLEAGGHDVVGIDPSPGAVAVARERGVTAREGSVEAIPAGLDGFSSILLLGNNLGLLASAERAASVLAELARVAAPGARIFGSGRDPYTTADEEHTRYQRENRDAGRWPGQARIRIRQGRVATAFYDYLFCSESELAALVAPSAWSLSEVRHDGAGNYLAVLELRAGFDDGLC